MKIEFTQDELKCMIRIIRAIPLRPLPFRKRYLLNKLIKIRDENVWKPCQCKGN